MRLSDYLLGRMYVSSVEIVGNIDFGNAAQSAVVVLDVVRYDRVQGPLQDSQGTTAQLTAIPADVYMASASPNRIPVLVDGGGTLQDKRLMFSANGYRHHMLKVDGDRSVKVGGVYNAPRSISQLGLFVYTMAHDGAGANLNSVIGVTFRTTVRYRRKL